MKEKILQLAKWLEKGEMSEQGAKAASLNLIWDTNVVWRLTFSLTADAIRRQG